jgi:hypothetical protein
MRTLEELKQDITAREAGRIKNAYMKKLGLWAAIGVVLLDAAWGACYGGSESVFGRRPAVFEIGTMLGV